MKLLLTSSGLTNPSLISALEDLMGKSAAGARLAFIPTAANVESGDKSWMIDDLYRCKNAGFEMDIVDISALSKEIWLPRLQSAEVLLLGGGNTFHLMHWVKKSGLQEELPELLQTRVYVGISAGSCIAGPTIFNSVQNLFGEKYELDIREGLGLVNFHLIPHLNSPYFEKITEENLREASKDMAEPVYAVDHDSAVKVVDDIVTVVSQGKYLVINE
ncbi:Type 1 glutamine amidotransferase-like domain-containing protein [Candidatus Woesebacteria bacterium]|nr:Type 1 glutamine amidotransferase-like domain-containing protein [Candidatus Woesebacteria bacterium]